MVEMKVYQSPNMVLKIAPHPEKFLNGLTTNSLDQPRNAFVNLHGRIIATFDQIKIGDEEFLIALEAAYVEPVLAHLDRYAKLSGVKMEKMDFRAYFDLEGDHRPQAGELVIPQKRGQLVLTRQKLESNVSDEEFLRFRVENEIPQQGIDYHDEFILNVSETEFVSFTKGCFLGQEPVAKVHHRSKPTWKLAVKCENECSEEERVKMTSRISDPQTGTIKGFVFVRND